MLDRMLAKVWIRGALLAAGGYLGQEIDRTATANLNRGGAAILFATLVLVGLLLSTRISLAAIFVALKERIVSSIRALSLRWARLTERRRKEKMKEAVVRKHALRLVEPEEIAPDEESGPVVREVRGAGRFQIRKVTKADLRKAAEALAQQEKQDVFSLYGDQDGVAAGFSPPDDGLKAVAPPKVPIPRPAKISRPAKRDLRLGNEEL